MRLSLLVLLSLLLAFPLTAAAEDAPEAPADSVTLDLPTSVPEAPTEQSKVREVQRKAARQINPFVKIFPLAVVMPMSVAGISLADTSVLVYDQGLLGSSSMRSAGLSLMAGGMALGITFDVLARTEHFFLGHAWHERLGMFIAGIALAGTGYALTSYGTVPALHSSPAETVGFVVSGAVAFNAGWALLVIDTLKFAFEDSAEMASAWTPGKVQFGGLYAAPTPNGGFNAGFGFRF